MEIKFFKKLGELSKTKLNLERKSKYEHGYSIVKSSESSQSLIDNRFFKKISKEYDNFGYMS